MSDKKEFLRVQWSTPNLKNQNNERKKNKVLIIVAAILFSAIAMGCIVLPPSVGKTKPFLDDTGNVIAGSVSEKIHLDINGASLGMFIRGKDQSKPVLLFLGGGPGIPEYLLEQNYPAGLENEFVVCFLEYRGTGLSYSHDISAETMTTEQYVSDAVEVSKYLVERFGQDKIYLLGHSFGTYIGLTAAAQHPELYHAYIAMSQVVNSRESEEIAYSHMLEQYQTAGNTKMANKFADYPILTSDAAYERYVASSLRDTAMHELGIGTMRSMNSVITGIFLPSLRCSAYTPAERINIWRGKAFAQKTAVFADSRRFNAFDDVPTLDIPIYFFAGSYDYTVAFSLQRAYYEQIKAPIKRFYSFNNSAHSPLFEENKKAIAILAQDVLAGTTARSDFGNQYDPSASFAANAAD